MKINSDSLKEDVLKLLEKRLIINPEAPAGIAELAQTLLVAAVEFTTRCINHDLIETEEDLVKCTHDVYIRIRTAMHLLAGHSVEISTHNK